MITLHAAQPELFGAPAGLPEGLAFDGAFVSTAEENELLAWIGTLPLQPARFRQYTARRQVIAFGSRFDHDHGRLQQTGMPELPAPLRAVRVRLGAWAGIEPDEFVHLMVARYERGTPLGWHRDAPGYGLIAGVSLGSAARLRLRPWPHHPASAPRRHTEDKTLSLELAPRSAYLISGAARWGWQHCVPPVPALRLSITLRTARSVAR